ncbi:MAG: beta-galactosidase [Clostridia bacterium]|nr:beta-galactosidase [Clostridia bacterium]
MLNNIPRPEHPNPQWKRDSFFNLNGEWQFEIDNSATGYERELHKLDSLKDKITLPFCPESKLSGVGITDYMKQVWYKKTLCFTEDDLKGNRVIFHIGAADFKTTVYVNGVRAGQPHIGGFVSFEYDITKLLNVGENIVTIQCLDDTLHPSQPAGKQSKKFYSYGCYYTRTTGIWQTVWYEIVPENYIKYAKITPDLNNCSVSVSFELEGCDDLNAVVLYKGKKVGEASKKQLSVTGNIEIQLSEKHIWDIGKGELYDIEFTFGKDKVHSYFGLRHIEMKNGKFYLNGRVVFQRLILDQGYYPDGIMTAPSEEALIKDIECSLSAGFNGARLHQKVFEPLFLYHADRLGYIVWGEYGSWGFDTAEIAYLSTFLPDWLSSVKRDYNHPSIITWCPLNETWDRVYGNFKHQDNYLIRIIYDQTKLFDPTRPCIDTSGHYHVITDIFDVHDYEQNPETFKNNYDKLYKENVLFDPHSARQKWRGEPVLMSEYGGIGFKLETNDTGEQKTSWSYGNSTQSYKEFYDRYDGLTTAMLDNPKIIGFCYTQLTDVEQEVNGLFTYKERAPKFDMEIISRINKKKAAIEE